MQPIIWQNIICGEKYINNIWILINYILAVIFVLIVGEVIDLVQRAVSNRTSGIRSKICRWMERNFYKTVNLFMK